MIVTLQTLVFFREHLFTAVDSLVRPYYKQLTSFFGESGNDLEDEEADDQVFSEFDDEKGVTFYPPVYAQRYAAVSDCLLDDRWFGKIEKVVDFGYHDMSFIKYLKDVPGIHCILGVDIETIPLRCSSDLLGGDEYSPKRESPLNVTLFQGNAADPDYRLIGCDAVIAIEMIEHMLPHDLERFIHTVFGFIKPRIAVFTTPNADFNTLFKALEKNGLRRLDHLFEWTREQFHDWCSNIVARYPNYTVTCKGIGPGPPGTLQHGCCSQLALFTAKEYSKQADLNLNSLALQLVSNDQNRNHMSEIFEGCWESSASHASPNELVCPSPQPQLELNCTTLQVTKFSKTTQNLMSKNRIDSIVHTREVVNEIRHLTKALNFNNFSQAENGGHVWCNINWGDNAPYWNQYYKIVREYAYPFETKSEEVRILDMVSEEINRLIDNQYDEECSVDVNRMEIPLAHLMNVLQHITHDIDRVRDLLEWNGYEIVDDKVIHSRLVVDTTSVATHEDDWQENFSDWDTTDLRTPSVSEGSTIVPDFPGRCLRHALDQKVRNLRKMISVDEDITTELDKVVCRLMKLALHSSMGRETPPPSRWMQCKLLDLLTLTEKSISRRKMCFIKSINLKPEKQPEAALEEDNRVKQLVDKYHYLLQPEKVTKTDDNNGHITDVDVDIEDDFLSTTSNEFSKENDYTVGMSPSLVIPQPVFSTEAFETLEATPDPNPLERTKAWLAEDLEVEPYPEHEINYKDTNSDDTDNSVSNVRHKNKISIKKQKASNKSIRESVADPCKTTSSKTSCKFTIKRDFIKHSKTQITKKVARKKSNCTNVIENPVHAYSSVVYDNYALTKTLNVVAAKPIPGSLIALCNPNTKTGKCTEPLTITDVADDRTNVVSVPSCISATEESLHIDIIMQDCEETIALRRTIGTESTVEPESETQRNVENLSNDFDKNLCTKHEVSTENVQSQTIFLNDINEPSTSKGIRHNISTDVQCGPDSLVACPLLSPATSVVKMPQVFSTGIIINDVVVDSKVKGTDFGTSTQETKNLKTITPRWRPVGITIKDSDANLCCKTECSTMTIPESVPLTFAPNHSSAVHSAVSFNGTKLLKPISSTLKIEDSGSEICAPSVASTSRTCDYFTTESKPTSNILMKSIESKEVESCRSMESPYKMLKLTCGAVHVHSFRDKQVSEDVIYQGEWQRYKPNANNARKKTLNYSTLRRGNEVVTRKIKENLKAKKVNSKEKFCRKKQEKKQIVNREAEPNNKPTQMRNVKLRKVSQQNNSSEDKKPRVSKSSVKISTIPKCIARPVKTTTKVPSKHAISANTSKNAKSTFTIKKSEILASVTDKKDNNKPQKLKKSYIPLYLKKTLHEDTLNKSLDSASDAMGVSMDKLASEIVPLKRSSTEDIRKDLLTFSNDLRVNMSYVVCRNDIEDKIILPDEQTSGNSKVTPKQKDMIKRAYSPSHSINSSTCSSPNSVATVKAASTRNKTSTKRHSAQSYKSNMTNNESDNASPPKKKVFKRSKTAKKTDIKDIGNKENIPESTKNFATKDKEKTIKSPFRPKSASAYIAQFETECSSSLVARQKAQIPNKSIVKIPPRKDSDEKRRANTPSVSKKRSLKSDTSLICDDFTQRESESLDSANMVFVIEPQPNYVDPTRTRNISRKSSAELAIKSNHNLMDELVHETSLYSNAGDILDAIRQILEETLDQIIVSYGNKHHRHLSSHTVILSNDDIQKDIIDNVISDDVPEIKTSNGFVETSQSDIRNSLNRSFDTTLGEEPTLNFNDTGLSIADMDLLSFKSVTSDSKYSEYYLADNEFNTSQEIDQGQMQNTTSVQDIFERKEPHLNQTKLQTTPGALAVQAFSGFSLDAEPVTGDQLDPLTIMDTDTSSLAVEINRLATSEELFISGRSSESYASCVLDEDAVVPNWLFQLISQQHAAAENREPNAMIGPAAAPHDEPMYDANGNVTEPLLGFGAGAGDGRGMHSDHSQDSSGRGTSLSSSETSSGLQSEVSTVLIDPSGQFEQLGDPMTSSSVMPMIDYHHTTSTRIYTDGEKLSQNYVIDFSS